MTQNQRGFSEIILILVIIALVGAVGFFVYQNTQLKQEVVEDVEKQDTEVSMSPSITTAPTGTPAPTPDSMADWETYTNTLAGFSIKYPAGWRKAGDEYTVGFGPQEIGEDVLWGVMSYGKSEKTVDQIKDRIGDQFPDRKQVEETIAFEGLTATRVVTTTNQFPDWYSVVIIIDSGNMLYAIGNGAQTDAALNEMLTRRTGKDYNISFKDFYTSFNLAK